ncbi:MAG TPA: PEP-CTERM sorting domain-containing protein [Bryobacteraceae bacterium]|nr:PEP-CTERM sorting domain-containing protein [Bryobacteraceae bacterium]
MNQQIKAMAVAALCILPVLSSAALITDPAGDFLPSYIGPRNGDMDVLQAEVFFDGSSFLFTSTSNAAIGTTPGGVFVWGINRGAGFATLPDIAPGVTFDSVVIIVPGGGSFAQALDTTGTTPIPAADVNISGAFLSARVPLSALPSLGATPDAYTVNLWPRSELLLIDPVVSDFAPNNSNAPVTVVPEPGTLLSLGAAFAALALRQLYPKGRRKAQAARPICSPRSR